MEKALILLPTFNERENIKELILEILSLNYPGLEVLVVDDNSPDGTALIVEKLLSKFKNVHLIVKAEREGRGAASLTGLEYARKIGADFLVEMDADFSHSPEVLLKIVDTIRNENLDAVFGSRFVKGGGDERGLVRKIITYFSNCYLRLVFWTDIKDCTSGFRAYRVSKLNGLGFQTVKARDPSILAEYLYYLLKNNARIKEIPFVFRDRQKGKSKLGVKQLMKGLWAPIRIKFQNRK